MDETTRKERLNRLFQQQENMFSGSVSLPSNLTNTDHSILINHPNFDWNQNEITNEIRSLKSLTNMDKSVFAKFKVADVPVMIAAGGLGTLSSVLLKDFFADLHDKKWGKQQTSSGGHSGENIDWVPGNKQPGGFGHRWKYGHDLLNPFEVDWKQYMEIAKQSGGTIPSWVQAPFYWFRHLFQDTFSKEGLPVPGHSLLRYFMDPSKKSTREVLQILGTIKMRDVAGAGVTNGIMGAYLWGTEKDIKRVISKPNYRAFSLMLGANLIALLSGLLVPPPNTSFNWGTIPVITYYSYHLIKLEKRVREEINMREEILNYNEHVIQKNDQDLINYSIMNDQFYNEFLKYEESIIAYYKEVMANHERVKHLVYQGGVK